MSPSQWAADVAACEGKSDCDMPDLQPLSTLARLGSSSSKPGSPSSGRVSRPAVWLGRRSSGQQSSRGSLDLSGALGEW